MKNGAIAFAFGVDGRKEELDLQNADVPVHRRHHRRPGRDPVAHRRHPQGVRVYGELNVPILANLEAELAVRYDHYSDFGSTTNPKVTVRYQPTHDLLLRGAYGTGFRAPTLYDLFQPPLTTNTAGIPRRPAALPDDSAGDGLQPAVQRQAGRQPGPPAGEVAPVVRRPGVGAEQRPVAGVDYYRIYVKNLITTIDR